MLSTLINWVVACAAQNAIVFQAFGIASRHLMCENGIANVPLTYTQTFFAGIRKHSCYLYMWQRLHCTWHCTADFSAPPQAITLCHTSPPSCC